MNKESDQRQLQAKRSQLKLMMFMMLLFMVLSPLLAPKLFADEFAKLKGIGLYIFYIGTPTVFGMLFLMYLVEYRRVARKIRGGIT